MTEQNVFKKRGNLNTFNDAEVLKALLSGTSRSVYSLEKELKEKPGGENVNYPTLRRHINKLENRGFVIEEKGKRKNGKLDKRETRKLLLGFKGLVYLILKENLNESEARTVVRKVLSEPTYKKVRADFQAMSNIAISSIQKTFEKMKPRVNLDHYNEDYVRALFYDIFVENLLDETISYMKKHFPEEKLERYVKRAKARRELKKLPREPIETLFLVYEHLRVKRKNYSDRIELLKPFIKVFEKVGVRP